ncbi:MAG: energy transducer TonB [Bacteroidetes bacterium]|nr:MAG: energy transducer TonB [Bacteroidota bacterium]
MKKILIAFGLLIASQSFAQEGNKQITKVKEEPAQAIIIEASYPGGQEELMKYIASSMKYPQDALDNGFQGKVYVGFVVNVDGSISDIELKRGVQESLDQEAMRIIRQMPNWNPAEQDGQAIKSSYTLPVSFKLN